MKSLWHGVRQWVIYCCCSVSMLCLTLSNPMDCSTPGFPVLHHLLEFAQFMSIESIMLSNCLILCCPLLLLPSIFPRIRIFSNKLALHIRWPNYWSFSFSNSPSNFQGWLPLGLTDLISWIQGTLKSLLQHHNSKTWILRCSAFLNVQLSHPYMTVRQTIPLTRQTFIDKVMSLLCDMLSRLIIAFLPRSKRLLISWLQSPSVVILEPPK